MMEVKKVFSWILWLRFRHRLARLQKKLIELLCREALYLICEVSSGGN